MNLEPLNGLKGMEPQIAVQVLQNLELSRLWGHVGTVMWLMDFFCLQPGNLKHVQSLNMLKPCIFHVISWKMIDSDICRYRSHRKNPGNTKHVRDGHWFVEIYGTC